MKKFLKLTALILIISISLIGCSSEDRDSKEQIKEQKQSSGQQLSKPKVTLLPGIEKFINEHPEYGSVTDSKEMPDWAKGKRQQVDTTTGSYLFYLYNNDVVGVWKYKIDGTREQVFHKDVPEPPQNINRPATTNLPEYTIISQFELLGGGKNGDILVPSFSRKTPIKEIESTLREIAKREGFTEASIYSTMDAYKANTSAAYAEAHPDALKNGFLGSLNKDGFTPGKTLFP